jgi:hypothetical protein
VTEHAFQVRSGSHNLTHAECAAVNEELRAWYPECRLEVDVKGEMGPFGVRVASAIAITLISGPDSRGAAASMMRRALGRVGRADLLDLNVNEI